MESQKIKVLFGEEAVRKYEEGIPVTKLRDSIQTYDFQSESETKAFVLGLIEGQGWFEFQIIE